VPVSDARYSLLQEEQAADFFSICCAVAPGSDLAMEDGVNSVRKKSCLQFSLSNNTFSWPWPFQRQLCFFGS